MGDNLVKGADEMFCHSCGAVIKSAAEICPKCGVRQSGNSRSSDQEQKERTPFILLGVFLGCFGAHNFYAGYSGKAVAQLLITLLSCFVLSPVSTIWAIIEVITITEDANGVALR